MSKTDQESTDEDPSYEYQDIDAPEDAPEPLDLTFDQQSEKLRREREDDDE